LILVAIVGLLAFGTIRYGHSFLAVTAPVSSDVLVVEGWLPDYALQEVPSMVTQRTRTMIYTTGGPTHWDPYSMDEMDTIASVAAARLIEFGVPKWQVQKVPCWVTSRDRTYSAAVALREWLQKNGRSTRTLNVITLGTHARRTRLMYEKAFQNQTAIGVIALRNVDYDEEDWWNYSEGVKEMVSEGAAYLYARFLFVPGAVPRRLK
jgi:hypothetical protein